MYTWVQEKWIRTKTLKFSLVQYPSWAQLGGGVKKYEQFQIYSFFEPHLVVALYSQLI